jgi:hypothetical protein
MCSLGPCRSARRDSCSRCVRPLSARSVGKDHGTSPRVLRARAVLAMPPSSRSLLGPTSQTPPPNFGRIPEDDLLGATVVMVTCSYRNNEFVRVGYWVSNTYTEPLAEGVRVFGVDRVADELARGLVSVGVRSRLVHRKSRNHPLRSTIPAGQEPPRPVPVDKIARTVLWDKPRVTRFAIDWQ